MFVYKHLFALSTNRAKYGQNTAMKDSSLKPHSGTLILITGPSGSGKDTLLDGVREALADDNRAIFARRIITRPGSAGGENHIPVSKEEFLAQKAAGKFWTDWQAHGLHYALPQELLIQLEQGVSVLANVSRTMTKPLSLLWPQTVVVQISAPSTVVNQRLNQRGRESGDEINKRLQRSVPETDEMITTISVNNDSTIQEGVARFQLVVFSILNQSGDKT